MSGSGGGLPGGFDPLYSDKFERKEFSNQGRAEIFNHHTYDLIKRLQDEIKELTSKQGSKKIGIYPGSFNPWHKGHRDILNKALELFDEVHVIVMQNPEKDTNLVNPMLIAAKLAHIKSVHVVQSVQTLKDAFSKIMAEVGTEHKYSIIRGLRNGNDLQYEMNNQYWNEDVGLNIPFVYFITDRSLAHVSSSAIRSVNKLGLKHDY